MRKPLVFVFMLALAVVICAVFALAQYVPPPMAAFTYSGVSWSAALSSATSGAVNYVPPAVALYCWNAAISKWVPADTSCFGSGTGTGTSSIVCGSGSGTTPPSVCTVAGTDEDGVISITTGLSPTNGGTIATITRTIGCPTGNAPIIRSANAAASSLTGNTHDYPAGVSTTVWVITANATGLAATTAYKWNFHAGCY